MQDEKFKEIAKICGFDILEEERERYGWGGRPREKYKYKIIDQKGTFVQPTKDLYFAVNRVPSRTGSIGKLVDIEYDPNCYGWQLSLFFEENKRVVKFNNYYIEHLEDHTGPTKYVFKRKKQEDIPPRKNKYGQELVEGAFVVGLTGSGKNYSLAIGHITRWTASSVWFEPHGCFGKITNVTKADTRLNPYDECIILQDEDFLKREVFSLILASNLK